MKYSVPTHRCAPHVGSSIKKITRSAIVILLGGCVAIANAGYVKADAKVWYKSIRKDHKFDRKQDRGNAFAVASYLANNGTQGVAKANEYWTFVGNNWVLNNWTYTYSPSKFSASASAWHSNFLGPGGDSNPDYGNTVRPAEENETSYYNEVTYQDLGNGKLEVRFKDSSYLKVRLETLEGNEIAYAKWGFNYDGGSDSAVILRGRNVPGGPPRVWAELTGLFKGLPYEIVPGPELSYTLRFVSPPVLTINATFDSELILSGESAGGDAIDSVPWHEPFDTYAAGSALIGQGGWAGWDDGPTTDATVTNAQAFSPPNSVRITGSSDVVHPFGGATFGRYVFKTKWYVSSSSIGDSYLILLNRYAPGDHQFYDWSVNLRARASDGELRSLETQAVLPLVLNAWADVRVEIDLDKNSTLIFYNGQLLAAHPWAPSGGQRAVEAVDLYSDNTSSLSYFDDLALVKGPADVLPISYTLFRGSLISGTLSSLFASDDDYLVVRNGPIASPTDAPITLILEGVSPTDSASELRFEEEGHVSINGLRQQIDLFNFATGAYELMDARPAPLQDTIVAVTPANPSSFIDQSTQAVRARLRIRPTGPLFTNTWRLLLDRAFWQVTPTE